MKYFNKQNSIGKGFRRNFVGLRILLNPTEGESVGYTVKTMEKDFCISNYPLEQSDFLYDSKLGMVEADLQLATQNLKLQKS